MGVHYLTAQMWQDRRPSFFDVSIYFRRPIFWDEAVQVGVIEDGGNWSGMGLLKLPLKAERVGTSSEVAKVGTELSIADYRLA